MKPIAWKWTAARYLSTCLTIPLILASATPARGQAPANQAKAAAALPTSDELDKKVERLRAHAKGLNPTILEQAAKPRRNPLINYARCQRLIGNREEASAILGEVFRQNVEREAALVPGDKSNAAASVSSTYGIIATEQIRSGDPQGALASLRNGLRIKVEAPITGIRLFELRDMVLSFAQLKEVDGARKVVKLAERELNALDDPKTREIYRPYLAGLIAAAGDLDEAFAMVDNAEMASNRVFADQCLLAVYGAGTASDQVIARGVLDRMIARFPAIALGKDDPKAKELAQRVLPPLEGIRGTKEGYPLIPAFARIFARVDDFAKAKELARRVEAPPGDPNRDLRLKSRTDTFNFIAERQANTHDFEEAQKTFAEAAENAKLIEKTSDRDGRIATLSRISWNMVRVDDFAAAFKLAEELPVGKRYDTYYFIAHAQRIKQDKSGSDATFLRALEDLKSYSPGEPETVPARKASQDEQAQRFVLTRQIQMQALMGNIPEARRLADTIADRPRREIYLAMIAESQSEVGELDAALEWIKNEPEALQKVLSFSLLNGIASYFASIDQAKGLSLVFPLAR